MFTVYIIYSESLQKYYTGYTGDETAERLRRHNSNHKGFTGKANDWAFVFQKEHETKKEAMTLEKIIKKRGAKRFLNDQN